MNIYFLAHFNLFYSFNTERPEIFNEPSINITSYAPQYIFEVLEGLTEKIKKLEIILDKSLKQQRPNSLFTLWKEWKKKFHQSKALDIHFYHWSYLGSENCDKFSGYELNARSKHSDDNDMKKQNYESSVRHWIRWRDMSIKSKVKAFLLILRVLNCVQTKLAKGTKHWFSFSVNWKKSSAKCVNILFMYFMKIFITVTL